MPSIEKIPSNINGMGLLFVMLEGLGDLIFKIYKPQPLVLLQYF